MWLTVFEQVCAVKDSTPICPTEAVSPDTLREIVSDTKSISVIAAKRRSHLAMETNSRVAGLALAAGLKSSVSMDSLVSTLADESTEVKRNPPRHGGRSQSKQDLKTSEGRMKLSERHQRKKRSRSFEASKRVRAYLCVPPSLLFQWVLI